MKISRIASAADTARLAERPYRDFMRHADVFDALCDSAARHAARRALSFIVSADPQLPARSWTHAEFIADVRRTANLFASLAGGDEPRVAMLLPAIPEAHFTLWGGEAAGVVCPINYLLAADHVAGLIDAARANIVVALGPNPQLDIWPKVAAIVDRCPGVRHVLAVGGGPQARDFAAEVAAMPGDSLRFTRSPHAGRIAALFHTGGTTGAPKLAQQTHGNQLHAAWGAAHMVALTERDVILNGFPLFHVAGALVYGLSVLLAGGEVVLPTLLGMRNAAFVDRYWRFVRRHSVSVLAAVPTLIATLLNTRREDGDSASVRVLLTGGSPLPGELAAAFEQRFGLPVRNIFGMTECAGVVCIEPFLAPRMPGSCGMALPYTEVQATRGDGSRCPAGEPGVLRLRGPNVGPGYTDARRNEGVFTDDGWLISGDIGHVDAEGRIFVTGRAKDLIIRSGHNIDPQTIEEVLLGHPGVALAAAVGAPDEYAGELPVAFVTLKPGAAVGSDELMRHAQARVAERPALPKRIDIVETMPVTAIGKVYKPALRALACERVFSERVSQAGLGTRVVVRVGEQPAGLVVHFAVGPGADGPDVGARLAALMRPFAIEYRVEPALDALPVPPEEARDG